MGLDGMDLRRKGGKTTTTIDNKVNHDMTTSGEQCTMIALRIRVEQASCKAIYKRSGYSPQDIGKTWVQHIRLYGFMHVHPSRFSFSSYLSYLPSCMLNAYLFFVFRPLCLFLFSISHTLSSTLEPDHHGAHLSSIVSPPCTSFSLSLPHLLRVLTA